MPKVLKLMEAHLEDFNATSTKSMTLVFFMDAVEHIARISRMLRQPRGNAMLVRLLCCSVLQCCMYPGVAAALLQLAWLQQPSPSWRFLTEMCCTGADQMLFAGGRERQR